MVIRKLIIPLNLPRSYVEINGSHNSHINIVYDIINCNKRGIITLSADGSITMKQVSELLEKNINFGNIHFDINSDIFDSPILNSSSQNIIKYIEKYEK